LGLLGITGITWDYFSGLLGITWDYFLGLLGITWDYFLGLLGITWDYLGLLFWDYLGLLGITRHYLALPWGFVVFASCASWIRTFSGQSFQFDQIDLLRLQMKYSDCNFKYG
jgi:hypothetical protein